MKQDRFWIYGRHSVEAAINGDARRVYRVLVTRDAAKDLRNDAKIKTEISDAKTISTFVGRDAVHQGCVAEVSVLRFRDHKDVLKRCESKEHSMIIALDHVTDPHNVGAVMRSALAFGADAIIATKDGGASDGPIVARTSAGACERLSVVQAVNLVRVLKEFQDAGYWIVGFDGSPEHRSIEHLKEYKKVVLVFGSEGIGLRNLTVQNCDMMMRIPMPGDMESLNVSNAAAIAMFAHSIGVVS